MIKKKLAAGRVARFHTEPTINQQSVGEHTYGVCQVLRYILDDNVSDRLFKAALDHDWHEHELGDTPHPAKRAYPELREVIKKIEASMDFEHGEIHNLTEKEEVCLKAADWLELALFAHHEIEMGNRYSLGVMENIFKAFNTLPSHIVPQKAKDLLIELGDYHVSKQ